MNVRILHFSGIDDRGQRLIAGQEFDISEALGRALLACGHAALPTPTIETAVVRSVETAAYVDKPQPRKSGRPRKEAFSPKEV